MRKLMLLAAMLAMVLVAAAPALAQAEVESDDDVDNSVNQYIDCDAVLAAAGNQVQEGDANAAADDGESAAGIAQELGISQEVVQNCLAAGGDIVVNEVVENGEDGKKYYYHYKGEDGKHYYKDDAGKVYYKDDSGYHEAAPAPAAESGGESGGGHSGGGHSGGESGGGMLPDTGGASLLTLGAGALLVGGGLLARRIFG
ncbi:MAG: hypothetical protein ACFB50_14765 [Rubrobacteraceae bacterium]